MAKVSFEEIETKQPEKQLAIRETAIVVAAPVISDPDKGLIGEWTSEDLRLPRLNLVNKSGELADNFTPGTWVVNREHAITTVNSENKNLGNPLTVIAATLSKQYQENTEFDPSTPRKMANTAQEVRELGGRVSREKGEGNFSELAHIELFVESPEGLSEEAASLFFYEFGGKKYGRFVYTASGGAFSAVAVTMASALKTYLMESGLIGGSWSLGSTLVKDSKNSWWKPVLRSAARIEPSVIQQIKGVL